MHAYLSVSVAFVYCALKIGAEAPLEIRRCLGKAGIK